MLRSDCQKFTAQLKLKNSKTKVSNFKKAIRKMHAKPTNKAMCFSYKVFKVHSKLTNKTTSFMELLEIEKY